MSKLHLTAPARTLALLAAGFAALTSWGADLPAINTPATADYYPGKFIWGDLFTDDLPTAVHFYTELFGWNASTIKYTTPSGKHPYLVLSVEDRPIAGIALRQPRMRDDAHGRWVGYVSVPDIARALAAATGNSGKILTRARELPQRGAQAIISDPDGAVIGMMHSSTGDPKEYLPEPGDWTWAELFARDPAAAGQYYHTVFAYDIVPDLRTGTANRFVLVSGGFSRASVGPVPNRSKTHPTWLLFVRVANVKDAVARALKLGGKVLVAPSEAPTEYWRAVIADPSGAHIGLVEIGTSLATSGGQ